jgi:hypothetical protein
MRSHQDVRSHHVSRHVSDLAAVGLALGVGLVAITSAGCLGAKESWRTQTVTSAEARVTPQEIYRRKDRLYVRVNYTNLGAEPVTIDRDAMTLQLANGRTIPRSTGTTTTHTIYTLPPNGAHAVFVDFKDDAIERERSATVLWKGAVFAGKREVEIAPTVVTAE